MTSHFDFSKVPYAFGLCAAENCPKATTCLRRIALQHAPADRIFLPTMNPNRIKPRKTHANTIARTRKSEITPAEQVHVINVAKELGVVLNDYFDGYVEEYNWNA